MNPLGAERRIVAWTMAITGSAGLAASFILVLERFHLLQDPDASLACDLGPFVACSPVMTSPAGAVFGFPNPLLGVICFTVVVTSAVVMLCGARLPRWFWTGLSLGMLFAAGLITWLQVQSIAVIGALCVWCIVVWAITIPLVVTTVSHALATEGIAGSMMSRAGRTMWDYRIAIIAVWYVLLIAAIAVTMGDELLRAVG